MTHTILIIDSDEISRQEFIACFDEYHFVEAGTGQQAFDLLSNNEINLVIIEPPLLDTSGVKLLNTIRETYPTLDIVLFSGSWTQNMTEDDMKKVTAYIEKPYDIEKTRQLLKGLIALPR